MTRLGRIGLSIFITIFLGVTAVYAKDRVAVMDFDNKSQYGGWRVGRGASDMLATELVKTGKYAVMERDKLASIIEEQNLGASGRIDPASAVRIGKILGVEYIITGAVTEYGQSSSGGGGAGVKVGKKGYHATVDIRMIDAKTSEIVFADSATHSKSSLNVRVFGIGGGENFNEKHASDAMRVAITALAGKVSNADLSARKAAMEKPAGSALIADVDGNIITLNQGSNGGFEIGQVVAISRKGKVIKDPSSGEILRVKYQQVGTIKLTAVETGYSEGEIVSGSGYSVGDVVR